jgi:hypothetical protein
VRMANRDPAKLTRDGRRWLKALQRKAALLHCYE